MSQIKIAPGNIQNINISIKDAVFELKKVEGDVLNLKSRIDTTVLARLNIEGDMLRAGMLINDVTDKTNNVAEFIDNSVSKYLFNELKLTKDATQSIVMLVSQFKAGNIRNQRVFRDKGSDIGNDKNLN